MVKQEYINIMACEDKGVLTDQATQLFYFLFLFYFKQKQKQIHKNVTRPSVLLIDTTLYCINSLKKCIFYSKSFNVSTIAVTPVEEEEM